MKNRKYRRNLKLNFKSFVATLPAIPARRMLRGSGACLFVLLLILSCGFLGFPACAQECPQSIIFTDDFESDPFPRWTISREGTNPSTFVARDWTWVNTLPDGRAGSAFFAADPVAFNLCSVPLPGQSGVLLLQSPAITLPGDLQGKLRIAFDHWVSLEEGFDGAQLMISVNGGPYLLVGSESNADFISNPYNFVLFAIQGNNPRFGQPAWSGVGGGLPDNSWGTTIVDLSRYAHPGDTIRLRWDMSTDYCFGTDAGWYVDNVKVYTCPLRTVSGTVTGNGQPLPGINVTAYQWSSEFYSWQPTESTVTGADGSYALRLLAGTYRIGFIDPQGPFGTVFFDGALNLDVAEDVVVGSNDVTNINAAMSNNHPITGKLTVDGIDMPGVAVTAWRRVTDASGSTTWDAVNTTLSELDGTYTLYVPDGTYRVEFATWQGRWPPIFYDGARSLESATDIVVAGAAVSNINAAFFSEPNSGPAIAGTVTVVGTGAPAGGVTVRAWKWSPGWLPVKSKETGPDGTYNLYIPEGTYRIEFTHRFNRYRPVFYGGVADVNYATDVIVTTAGAPNINAQLVENHSISGTLTADVVPGLPPGTPPTVIAAYQSNAFNGEWDRMSSAFSAADGSYVLYVPEDGTYRIGFDPTGPYQPTYYDGADTVADATDVIVAGGNVSNINVHLRRIVFADPWPPATALSSAGQDAWTPQVAAGPDGAVTAVWYRWNGRNSRVQMASRAPNEYWSPPMDLSLANEDAFDPQVAMGDRGTAVVVWRQWDGAHYRVLVTSRGENGKWSAPVKLSKAGEDAWDPKVAMGPHGMAVVAWRRTDGTSHQVQATTRVAYGPWSSPVILSTVGGDAWDPRVAVGSDGSATVVWSRSDGSNERVQATTRSPNGSWSSPVTVSDPGTDGLNPQVVVGRDGAATAVWHDVGSNRILTSSRPAKGVWSSPAPLSTVSGSVYDPQLAVDPDGMVTAVWSWWNLDHAQIQTTSRAPGGTWSRPKTLSNCCDNAESPRLTAGSAGRFTAVWRESSPYGDYEHLLAAIRTADGVWSAAITVSEDSLRAYGAQVAAGLDGTVAAVWERRDGSDDRIQAVLIPVPASRRKP